MPSPASSRQARADVSHTSPYVLFFKPNTCGGCCGATYNSRCCTRQPPSTEYTPEFCRSRPAVYSNSSRHSRRRDLRPRRSASFPRCKGDTHQVFLAHIPFSLGAGVGTTFGTKPTISRRGHCIGGILCGRRAIFAPRFGRQCCTPPLPPSNLFLHRPMDLPSSTASLCLPPPPAPRNRKMSVDTTLIFSVLEHLAASQADLPSESLPHVASAIQSLSSAFGVSLDDPKQVWRLKTCCSRFCVPGTSLQSADAQDRYGGVVESRRVYRYGTVSYVAAATNKMRLGWFVYIHISDVLSPAVAARERSSMYKYVVPSRGHGHTAYGGGVIVGFASTKQQCFHFLGKGSIFFFCLPTPFCSLAFP